MTPTLTTIRFEFAYLLCHVNAIHVHLMRIQFDSLRMRIKTGLQQASCERALTGIEGYYTNHSLHATVTSRLYQSGVDDEQLVMEHTGHQSTEGVHSYRRTSDQQREALSDLLNHECPAGPSTAIIPEQLPRDQPILNQNLLSSSQTQTSQHRSLNLPSATFANCTVNFTLGLPQIRRESKEL